MILELGNSSELVFCISKVKTKHKGLSETIYGSKFGDKFSIEGPFVTSFYITLRVKDLGLMLLIRETALF